MAAIVQKTRDFTVEVRDEMKKVTWPDAGQLKQSTWVIIVFVIIVSLIIFAMDKTISFILGLIINMFTR